MPPRSPYRRLTWPLVAGLGAFLCICAPLVSSQSPQQPDLNKIATLLKPDTPATLSELRAAEDALQQRIRALRSADQAPPLTPSGTQAEEKHLAALLQQVRGRWIDTLVADAREDKDWQAIDALLEKWLPTAGDSSPVPAAAVAAWTTRGEQLLQVGQAAAARVLLTRIESTLLHAPRAEPLRLKLKSHAEALAKKARSLDGAPALQLLEEALALWPHLPDARLELVRRHNPRPLVVAVTHLPELLSPGTAATTAETHALPLLFESLVQVRAQPKLGPQPTPVLAAPHPLIYHGGLNVVLARDAFWSSGEPITALDIRHTAQLLARGKEGWLFRELLELPRLEGDPLRLLWPVRQGLFHPLDNLAFPIVPLQFGGKPLTRADDPAFARAPVGSGPFRFVGTRKDRKVAAFELNALAWRKGARLPDTIAEIHFHQWQGAVKELGSPLPPLVLDPPAHSLDALKKVGYRIQSFPATRRVHFLAVNHRVAALANTDLRKALAHAIDRVRILKEVWQGAGQPLSGPFPAHCWAAARPPRVPSDPHHPELARSLAKKAAGRKLRLTLKHADDDPDWTRACALLAKDVTTFLGDAGLALDIEPAPITPRQLQTDLDQRQFELAVCHYDFPDERFLLWPLFDPHPDAVRPGGSNFLGYDSDAKLQSLLRASLAQRHFPALQEVQHNLHVHLYERMPLIPLWQLPVHHAFQPGLDLGTVDPLRVFANVREWKWSP